MSKPRRSRIRRVLKWGGVAVCVLSLATWAGSTRWALWLNGPGFSCEVAEGALWVFGEGELNRWAQAEYGTWKIIGHEYGSRPMLPSIKGATPLPFSGPGRMYEWSVVIPLWVLVVIGLVPFVGLAWRGRRIPPKCCPTCGHNLTGSVSGKCPECGNPCRAEAGVK
jgi:hypothetical protein